MMLFFEGGVRILEVLSVFLCFCLNLRFYNIGVLL